MSTELAGTGYSPYVDGYAEIKSDKREGWKQFSNPRLHRRRLHIDSSMLGIFDLMDKHGISYKQLADELGITPAVVSNRMINGCTADTRAEMSAAIRAHDTCHVTPGVYVCELEHGLDARPITSEEELERIKDSEDAIRWRLFVEEAVFCQKPETVGAWAYREILRLQGTNITTREIGHDEPDVCSLELSE